MSTVEQFYPPTPEELKSSRKLLGLPSNLDEFKALDQAISAYKNVSKVSLYNYEAGRQLEKKTLKMYHDMAREIETMARNDAYNALFEAAKAFVETCDPCDLMCKKLALFAEENRP